MNKEIERFIKDIETRVTALEARVKGGRPPTRLEEAKKYLKKRLKKPVPVKDVVHGSGFNHALLSKARKEIGAEVYIEEGIWYWK